MLPAQMPTVVIVTAIQSEIQAVVQHLEEVHEEVDKHGTVYEVGLFRTPLLTWKVAVAECGEGNVPANSALHFAAAQFDPDVLLFVGVAGGLKDDIFLGDVIASTHVYLYQSGKDDGVFYSRPKLEFASRPLEQRARATARHQDWLSRIDSKVVCPPNRILSRKPKAKVAPIAAGDIVVASEVSEAFQLIRTRYNDAHAVEMEGFGALQAARVLGISAIVIRGISDNVVDKAQCDADGWQPVAAAHASAFAFEMLVKFDPGQFGRRGLLSPDTQDLRTNLPAPGLESLVAANIDVDGRSELATANDGSDDVSVLLSHGGTTELVQSFGVGWHHDSVITTSLEIVKTKFEAASEVLLGWPAELGDGKWILRPELRQLQDYIGAESSNPTVLLGEPGSGKSALLARLGAWCQEQGLAVLGIKADALPTDVSTQEQLASFLQLPESVAQCVRQVSLHERVVLLVDQLDALAALVDLHSGRLNVLLNLIKSLSGQTNVKIVCSCRAFEFRHDTRIARIDAETIELELPAWDQVHPILMEHGVDASEWAEDRQNVLRYPQHLNVFLKRLSDTTEEAVFRNYRQLYEDLWRRRITNFGGSSARSDAIHAIAQFMSDEETLWVPIVRFEKHSSAIDGLVADGILRCPDPGLSIGFQHQTLFEHARARAFASGHGSIAEHALTRQDSLFARPTIWATLGYLRDAAPAAYGREMTKFFTAELRVHLRYLLIEFLGQVSSPDEFEVDLLTRQLDSPRFRPKALTSVRGNERWFRALLPHHLTPCMQLPIDESWPMVPVLSEAWSFARADCLELIRRNWLHDKGRDWLILRSMDAFEEWDDETVDWVCRIIRRSDFATHRVCHLATSISATSPQLAPRLIATALTKRLELLEVVPDPAPPPKNEQNGEGHASELLYQPKERFDTLLRDRDQWYELNAVAEGAPAAFLTEVGPWLLRIADHVAERTHQVVRRYRSCLGCSIELDDENSHYNPIPTAVLTAMRQLAHEDFHEFQRVADQWGNNDTQLVQEFLARGFREAADIHPGAALAFLTADPRRLTIRSSRSAQHESTKLIAAIVGHLDASQICLLETTILNFSQYHSLEVEDRDRRELDDMIRARLLSDLPTEFLSERSRQLIAAYEEELTGVRVQESQNIVAKWDIIESPMSAEQLEATSDEDLIALFSARAAVAEQDRPGRVFDGSIQLHRELSEFAKRRPQRVASLLSRCQPAKHEEPVAYSIHGLSESDFPKDQLTSLIHLLSELGFKSPDFRIEAATTLEKCVIQPNGLSDKTCRLLESWLPDLASVANDDAIESRTENERDEAILWGHHGGFSLPHGNFFVLHTLMRGLLLREKPDYDEWLRILLAHVERDESPATWLALANDLLLLANGKSDVATSFVSRLFERYAGVRDSKRGVMLIAHLWRKLPEDFLRTQLDGWRTGSWALGAQAFGELAALGALRPFGHDWIIELVEQAVSVGNTTAESVRLGFAYTASHLWIDAGCRERATELLVRLVPGADIRLADVISEIFSLVDDLPADAKTDRVLLSISTNTAFTATSQVENLIERLADYLPRQPELVLQLSHAVLEKRGQEVASIQYALAASTGAFVEIALTLQRLGGEWRSRGLELFEQLLELGVSDAVNAVHELDKRLIAPSAPIRRRRRSRKRQRSATPD